MKILHINGNYIGTPLHQVMADHLENLGITNEIVIPNNGVDKPVIELNPNASVLNCFKPYHRFFFLNKQKRIINSIKRKYIVQSYDLIHAYTLFTDGYTARKLSEMSGKPYVVAVRNTDLNIFMKYFFWLRKNGIETLLKADKILFLSKPYYEKMLSYVPADKTNKIKEKCVFIPNGIDDFWISNVGQQKNLYSDGNSIKLVFAGRIDKNKNILAIIEAIKVLNKAGYDCHLSVVGRIVDESIFSEMQKSEFVQYLGLKAKEELIRVYRENDIFIMPSFTETFGLVYAEAMSQGLPVIYTQFQGFDKQFEDGVVGFPVNPNDAKNIADAIIKICDNYSAISKNCIKCVDRFDWNLICQQYTNIYGNIIETREG